MVTMYRDHRWKIAVYGRDHGVAHFHVEGPDFRCSIAIESLAVIIGTCPDPILRAARDWAKPNRPMLLQTWQELNG